jgi:ZIP family zinc transporter
LAVGSSFGGVAAGIPEASIAGAVTLAIGLEFRIFRRIAVAMPLRNEPMEKFMYGQSSCLVEPVTAVLGALQLLLHLFCRMH